ncbi:MAG: hypothetical protein ACOVKC_10240 [Brevundimonas sp.]
MPNKPLSPALMDRVLKKVATLSREYPLLPYSVIGGRCDRLNAVGPMVLRDLMAESGASRATWQSRIQVTKTQRPLAWAAALKGQVLDGTQGEGTPAHLHAAVTRRFLLTAAQDDTPVHEAFWKSLQTFARHVRAEIMVGGFTYGKALFTDHETRAGVFAEAVRPYLRHENVSLSPDLVFCAKMNTLPTAVRPLSGLETYTQGRWGVFPHAKVQLVSVPALNGAHPALLMTTGACTRANYIEKKAGLKAEFHHVIGATLVEIDPAGRVFCRQINASDDGSFQDLTTFVSGSKVSSGRRVEAITWGDIHRSKIDPGVARSAWGLDVKTDTIRPGETMLDELRPRHQFFHDLIDFEARNHHRKKDHAFHFEMLHKGRHLVDGENRQAARFLRLTAREWCESVVIASNHNESFPRWLLEADPRQDPHNALIWFRANTAIYEAIERGDESFDVVRWALERHDADTLQDITFVPRDGSYVICQATGGIECSLHGDQGPNGSRGSPLALTKVATRINIGHGHQAWIGDGVYAAGLCGLFDQGYNEGPSGWSHTQIVTYSNGKRSLVTFREGHWRAT